MTHIGSLKRTSHQAELSEPESQFIQVASLNHIPKLYKIALKSCVSIFERTPLNQRIAAIQNTSLTLDLKMKLLQAVMAEKLSKAETAETRLSIFNDIKTICTIKDENSGIATYSSDYFETYFQKMIAKVSENKHHSFYFTEFDKMIKDPSQDPAILKMIGLWYECKVEQTEDLRAIYNDPRYITKIQLTYNFGEVDLLMLLDYPLLNTIILG